MTTTLWRAVVWLTVRGMRRRVRRLPSSPYTVGRAITNMKALDRLKAAASMKPQRRIVDLGHGEEFEYWSTPTTLAERARAQKQARSDDATDFAMQLLVAKAKDENGAPLFTVGDVPAMRNDLPAWLVEALMLQLLTGQEGEDDEEMDMKSVETGSRKGRRAGSDDGGS